MTQDILGEATALANSDADLGSLIRFARAHDPTQRLRVAWGTDYQASLDTLLSRASTALDQHIPFTGSADELLLCMAHLVASAPYLGLPDEQVRRRLGSLLQLMVQQSGSVSP